MSAHDLGVDHLVLLAAVHLSYLLRSHRPFVTATLVPPKGVRVQLTGKCSSFVQLHVSNFILSTLHWY